MRSFHISETSLLSMLLGVVFLSSCKEYNHSEEVECEKIVFSSLEQRPLSELQADTTYLLLRSSNPDCPVGSVSKMIKSNGRYYFLDGRYRNAGAYDSLGRSIDRIGVVGKGHLEYLRCHDIAIDNQGYNT